MELTWTPMSTYHKEALIKSRIKLQNVKFDIFSRTKTKWKQLFDMFKNNEIA